MKTSESILKIAPALLKAQKELSGVKKKANNPFFKSKYADLPEVIKAVKDILNNNGIAFLQPISNDGVDTVLLHESGEFICSESPTPIRCKTDTDPQALGSAITYARRYSLQSIMGLPAVDDDAEKAMSRSQIMAKEVLGVSGSDTPCEMCGEKLTLKSMEYYNAHPTYKKICYKCSQLSKSA